METRVCRHWSGKEGLDEAPRASITDENTSIIKIMLYLVNLGKNQEQWLTRNRVMAWFKRKITGGWLQGIVRDIVRKVTHC